MLALPEGQQVRKRQLDYAEEVNMLIRAREYALEGWSDSNDNMLQGAKSSVLKSVEDTTERGA